MTIVFNPFTGTFDYTGSSSSGGVSQITAGMGISISPSGGTGNVTINSTGSGSPASPDGSIQYNNSGSFGGSSNATLDSSGNILSNSLATDTIKGNVDGIPYISYDDAGSIVFGTPGSYNSAQFGINQSYFPSFWVKDYVGNYAFQINANDVGSQGDYVQTYNNVLDDGVGNEIIFGNITSPLLTYTIQDIVSGTMTQDEIYGGGLIANGDYYQFSIYAYRVTPWGLVYSLNPLVLSDTDNGDTNPFRWDLSWSSVTLADGYMIVINSDPNLSGYSQDVGNVTAIGYDGSGVTGSLNNPSPSSPFTYSNYYLDANGSAGVKDLTIKGLSNWRGYSANTTILSNEDLFGSGNGAEGGIYFMGDGISSPPGAIWYAGAGRILDITLNGNFNSRNESFPGVDFYLDSRGGGLPVFHIYTMDEFNNQWVGLDCWPNGALSVGFESTPQAMLDIYDAAGTGKDIGNSTTGKWDIDNNGSPSFLGGKASIVDDSVGHGGTTLKLNTYDTGTAIYLHVASTGVAIWTTTP